MFFRSENVDWITGNGWQQIHDARIRTVVDLRQQGERNTDPPERPGWLTTVHVDLDGLENKESWADYWDNGLVGTAFCFLPHLAAMSERAGAAISALVNAPPGGVLFHCMGGRDRTGLLAMALLHAIGTDPECIVDDYLETVRLGDARAANGKRINAEPRLEEVCRQHGTTTEGAFGMPWQSSISKVSSTPQRSPSKTGKPRSPGAARPPHPQTRRNSVGVQFWRAKKTSSHQATFQEEQIGFQRSALENASEAASMAWLRDERLEAIVRVRDAFQEVMAVRDPWDSAKAGK